MQSNSLFILSWFRLFPQSITQLVFDPLVLEPPPQTPWFGCNNKVWFHRWWYVLHIYVYEYTHIYGHIHKRKYCIYKYIWRHVQLTLEQYGFDLCGSIYPLFFLINILSILSICGLCIHVFNQLHTDQRQYFWSVVGNLQVWGANSVYFSTSFFLTELSIFGFRYPQVWGWIREW